eukprot:1144336-Pelagomonas_calceolata.AAC.2
MEPSVQQRFNVGQGGLGPSTQDLQSTRHNVYANQGIGSGEITTSGIAMCAPRKSLQWHSQPKMME